MVNLFGFIGPHVFLTKSGHAGIVLESGGADYECLDVAAVDAPTKRLESALRLFDESYRVYQLLFKRNQQDIVSPWLVKWKKVAPPKTVQRELPYLTVAQMAAIVKAAKTQMNRALFALAAGTGARAGELFALRVETDLNLNEQTITIRRSVFEGEENTSKSGTGDEDRTRAVPIDASAATELRKHLQGRRSGYLFQTRNGTPLRLSNVLEDRLQPILRKLKLVQPGMGMHAFRRCRISHLVCSGVSRQVIRDWCGHSSDKMIDHYTKMLRHHHAPEMAKVKPLLGRSWTPAGRRESGTLVHRIVKLRSNLPVPR